MKNCIPRLLALLLICALVLGLTACATEAAPEPTETRTPIRIPEPVEYEDCTDMGTPLADARVRQALALAINVDTVIEALYDGTAQCAAPEICEYDPQRAKELLAEAGWPSEYVLDVVYFQEEPQIPDLLNVLAHYWEAVGIRAEVRKLEGDVEEQLWTAPEDPEGDSTVKWDLAIYAADDRSELDFYRQLASDHPRNSHLPQIDGLDEAIEKGDVDAIQSILAEQTAYLPLFYQDGFICVSDRVDTGAMVPGKERYVYEKDILNWTTDREDSTLYVDGAPAEDMLCPLADPGHLYQELVFDRLVGADSSLNPAEGRIAESYTLSDDGKTATFTLREELLWHDGEDLTAEDVKFTFELYLQCADLDSALADVLNKLEGAEAFVNGDAEECTGIAVEENQVTFRFEEKAEDALFLFSQWPVLPKHKLENVKPAKLQQNKFWKEPVGSGPFRVSELTPGKTCLLERWEDHWQTGEGNINFIRMSGYAQSPAVSATRELLDYGWSLSTDDALAIAQLEHMEVLPVEQQCKVSILINQFPHESYFVQEEATEPTE